MHTASIPRAIRRCAGFPATPTRSRPRNLAICSIVAIGGQVLALDTRELADNDDSEVIWQAAPAGRFAIIPKGTSRRAGRPLYHPTSQRKRSVASAGILSMGLGPVTPYGIVFQEQQRLRCVDPVSGETLWSRTDVPQGCELFGDDQFVLAANGSEAALYVIRMSDGQLVERRELPETPWLLTAGRNVAQLLDTKVDNHIAKDDSDRRRRFRGEAVRGRLRPGGMHHHARARYHRGRRANGKVPIAQCPDRRHGDRPNAAARGTAKIAHRTAIRRSIVLVRKRSIASDIVKIDRACRLSDCRRPSVRV